MRIHLIDGTYELFRSFFGAPGATSPSGAEVGATRGLIRSFLALIRDEPATHVAVAFDTEIESFRNELFEGYKTGEGIPPELHLQFPLAERACHALGIVVWPMVEFEADDALATGAHLYGTDPRVEQVVLCSADKDLAQCVDGNRVVTYDRRRQRVFDDAGVREHFGVDPRSIPDYLALVGDSADGIPGIPRWGAKSTAAVLQRYGKLEEIPDAIEAWDIQVRGGATLAKNLVAQREDAELYRKLAILRTDVPLKESVDDLEWQGALRGELMEICEEIGLEGIENRVPRFRE